MVRRISLWRTLSACCWAGLLLSGCKLTPNEAPTPALTPKPAPPARQAPPAPQTGGATAAAPGLAPVPAKLPVSPTRETPGATGVFRVAATGDLLKAAAPTLDEAARAAAVSARLDQVRAWLARSQFGGVVLAVPENYAWLTLGSANDLGPGRAPACLAVLPDRALVLAPSDAIDAARAGLRGLALTGRTWRWDLANDPAAAIKAVAPLLGTQTLAADTHVAGTVFAGDELAQLRAGLGGGDVDRLRWLSASTAQVVAEALDKLTANDTEQGLVQRLTDGLHAKQIGAAWVRAVALERLERDGLAEPGQTPLTNGAAVLVVGQRWGLRASVGRSATAAVVADAVEGTVTARRLYGSVATALRPGLRLGELAAAVQQAATAAGLSQSAASGVTLALGASEPAGRPVGPQTAGSLTPGDVLTLTIRLPQAFVADTLLVGAGDVVVLTSAPGQAVQPYPVGGQAVGLPTLRGAEQAVAEAELQRVASEARLRGVNFLEQVLGAALTQARAVAKAEPVKAAAPSSSATPAAPAKAAATPAEAPAPAGH